MLSKIQRLAILNAIQVIKVNPAFTSVIGSLKYTPQLNIDKDIAGAYVIARRALFIQSLQSKPSWGKKANGRNFYSCYIAWQVLRVAILFPILGKFFTRDFSPLKAMLVQGKWDRMRSRSVPLEALGDP